MVEKHSKNLKHINNLNDNLTTIAVRESKQVSSLRDIGTPRAFFENSTVILAFATLSKKHGNDLELCVDYLHREYLKKGDVSSEQSKVYRDALTDFYNIFLDCEDTIEEEHASNKEKEEEGESDSGDAEE